MILSKALKAIQDTTEQASATTKEYGSCGKFKKEEYRDLNILSFIKSLLN